MFKFLDGHACYLAILKINIQLQKYFGPIVYHEEVFRVQNSSLFLFCYDFFLEAAQRIC